MKPITYISTLILSLLVTSSANAQGFVAGFLNDMRIFPGGDGKTMQTYEDCPSIQFDPMVSNNSTVKFFKESQVPEGFVKKSEANKWFNTVQAKSIASEDYNSVQELLMAHFYLDFGTEGAGGAWEARVLGSVAVEGSVFSAEFPHSYGDSNNPRSQRFFLCMTGGYRYVESATKYEPDALSCKDASWLCDRKNCPELVRQNTATGPNKKPTQPATYIKHMWGENNVYADFKNRFLGQHCVIVEAPTIDQRNSGVACMIIFNDRTPPWVRGCDFEKKEFPRLGEYSLATTGDWYNVGDLSLTDNRSTLVKVKVLTGKIDTPLSRNVLNWRDKEDWNWTNSVDPVLIDLSEDATIEADPNDPTSIKRVFKNGAVNTTIMPNTNYGFMNYSIYAQDTEQDANEVATEEDMGNFNPGCATIVEDDPENCYGLPNGSNLNAGAAAPWPYSVNGTRPFNINNMPGSSKIHTGLIKITDNDCPNLLIRITSVKTGEQFFFPPCVSAGELTITNSPDYPNAMGSASPNQDEYDSFVGTNILPDFNYNVLKNSDKKPYYRVLSLKESKYMSESDKAHKASFIDNANIPFINKHFRIEDQSQSDTRADNGMPDINLVDEYNEDLFGKRNGSWESVVAYIETNSSSKFTIQEDVEYKVDVWFDDSVKWANAYFPNNNPNGEPLDAVISKPTGIESGNIEVCIPNQYPVYTLNTSLDCSKSLSQSFRVVFREPTKAVDIDSEQDLIDNKFPYICVKVKDYADNLREIKLYFQVTDENATIRTLQRKHETH